MQNRTPERRVTEPRLPELSELTAADWATVLSPEGWLGHTTPPEYLGISGTDVLDIVPPADIDACFAERLIRRSSDAKVRACLLEADVRCIAHALSALPLLAKSASKYLLPRRVQSVAGNQALTFDHIGIEIFGKLEWYIELFDNAYSRLGITATDQQIFPSVQVRHALSHDDQLSDVRIARLFFAHDDATVNLEVLEATQPWTYIALRQAGLYAHLNRMHLRSAAFSRILRHADVELDPVGHLAFRVARAETVEAIQDVLLREHDQPNSGSQSGLQIRPYVRQVFFNPSDDSINTKFVVSINLGNDISVDSRIFEVISYDSMEP